MLKRKSMNSSASAKMVMTLLAFAFVLTPTICGCLGLQGQAMAATSHVEVKDTHDHAHADKTSGVHHQSNKHGANCDGAGCDDCSYANTFEGVKSDRFVATTPIGIDSLAAIDDSDMAITPIATLVASVYPRRGPPPLVRSTLVALNTLLLI